MQLEKSKDQGTEIKQFTDNWIWRTVHCLIESPNFDPSPKWIAKKLDISVEKAVDAIEGLLKLGLIEQVAGTYKVKSQWFQVLPKDLSHSDLLDTHIKLAPQILSRLNEDDKYTVQFFRGNEELLKKYVPRFIELYKQMDEEAQRQKISDVMASEISFVRLTKDIGGAL